MHNAILKQLYRTTAYAMGCSIFLLELITYRQWLPLLLSTQPLLYRVGGAIILGCVLINGVAVIDFMLGFQRKGIIFVMLSQVLVSGFLLTALNPFLLPIPILLLTVILRFPSLIVPIPVAQRWNIRVAVFLLVCVGLRWFIPRFPFNGNHWIHTNNAFLLILLTVASLMSLVLHHFMLKTSEAYEVARQELQTQQEEVNELRHINTMKNIFLGAYTHDMSTPVNVIMSCLELFPYSSPDEQARFLRIMEGQARAQRGLIHWLLDLQRLEDGRITLEFSSTDIGEYVREIAYGFEPIIQKKGLALSVGIETSQIITIDRVRMLQIIQNLLSNAIKFTAVGTISVRVAREDNQWVSIAVHDTGRGIHADALKRLFNRYEQVEHQDRNDGYGLGLATAGELVRLHGGLIQVSSVVGQGSTFTVVLPIHSEGGDDVGGSAA